MVYNPKNDPAGPRKDSSGLNASSASRPSSGGYNSAKSGGNLNSGVMTGKTTGTTFRSPTGSTQQKIVPTSATTYKKAPPAQVKPVKPKVPNNTRSLTPAPKGNLEAYYNYQYPKGMSYGNYMMQPGSGPAKRGPSGSGMGTVTTVPKTSSEAPGYSVQKKMGMAKGGMVPGAKKSMAPMAKKGSKSMGKMSMMAKKPKR
jgi:hypothetical protein